MRKKFPQWIHTAVTVVEKLTKHYQSKRTFRWYSFRQIVPVGNVRQTIYCQKKSIVTSQAPSPAIGHNISVSTLWEEIPRRKQHVFPREVYINTNKQDSYVNFVKPNSIRRKDCLHYWPIRNNYITVWLSGLKSVQHGRNKSKETVIANEKVQFLESISIIKCKRLPYKRMRRISRDINLICYHNTLKCKQLITIFNWSVKAQFNHIVPTIICYNY